MRHATGVDVPVQRASASACRAGSVRGKGVFVAVLIRPGRLGFSFFVCVGSWSFLCRTQWSVGGAELL